MKAGSPLDRVYTAKTQDALAEAYAAWASSYDRETAAKGYVLPFIIAAWLTRHLSRGTGPVLDAGCGTGLSGPYLQALGYDDLVGLDLSPKMLALAEARGCYRSLTQVALGGQLPWDDGHFAASIAAGVFTQGHAPAASLDELVRITKRGGYAVFTVRDTVLDGGGFRAKFSALEKAGRWRRVEESRSFRAFAIAEPEVLVQAFVFEIT